MDPDGTTPGGSRSPIYVTGLPRSGTTFLATILSLPSSVRPIGEALDHAIGVDHHYPYPSTRNRLGERYDEVLEKVLTYRKVHRYRIGRRHPSLRGWVRHLLGSRGTLHYWRAGVEELLGREPRLLLKEPHGALLTTSAVAQGCKAVVLVRHPAAQVTSKVQMGWTGPNSRPSSLLEQPDLVEAHLDWLPAFLSDSDLTTVEELGLMWRCIYEALFDQLAELPSLDDVRLVTHEQLCLDPLGTFEQLFDHLDLPFAEEVEDEIVASTSSQNPVDRTSRDAHEHGHRRDSRSLAWRWKSRIEAEDLERLRAVTAPIADRFYGEGAWSLDEPEGELEEVTVEEAARSLPAQPSVA